MRIKRPSISVKPGTWIMMAGSCFSSHPWRLQPGGEGQNPRQRLPCAQAEKRLEQPEDFSVAFDFLVQRCHLYSFKKKLINLNTAC
ncbi:Kinesin-Like Protein Kif1A [Manis pentadactyla]|nr:Kinesin-Like Protein Kif1A [Manis pentadactyla]